MRNLTPDTEMYHIADKILKFLMREYVETFSRLKSLLTKDEINADYAHKQIDKAYGKMTAITKTKMLELAQLQFEYIQQDDYDLSLITNAWLEELFDNYNDTTKYVYSNEIERKKAYLFEAIMSRVTPVKDVDKAMRLWCLMIGQMAIDVTDKATQTAYEANGVKKVKWITEHDARRCEACAELDGKTFRIKNIPAKPHPKCRCFTIPI